MLISSWNSYLKKTGDPSVFVLRELEIRKLKKTVERARKSAGYAPYKDFDLEGNAGDFTQQEQYHVVKLVEDEFDMNSVVGKTFGFEARLVVRARFASLDELLRDFNTGESLNESSAEMPPYMSGVHSVMPANPHHSLEQPSSSFVERRSSGPVRFTVLKSMQGQPPNKSMVQKESSVPN